MALCSLSTGRIGTPFLRAASMTIPPAMTSTSLLASAIVFPASMAHNTASSAAVPDEAHSTMSTSGCAAISQRPSLPTPGYLGRRSTQRGAQLVHRLAGGHRHGARPEFEDLLRHRRDVGRRRKRDDFDAVAMGARHVERARADRAGRAEDGDPFHWRASKGSKGSKSSRRSKGIVLLQFQQFRGFSGRNKTPERRRAARRCDRARRRGPG